MPDPFSPLFCRCTCRRLQLQQSRACKALKRFNQWMGLEFFISKKSEKSYYKEFNVPYLTWNKFERLTNSKRNYFRFILKPADAVGGEIWKCCSSMITDKSKQINKIDVGFLGRYPSFAKTPLNLWIWISRYEN